MIQSTNNFQYWLNNFFWAFLGLLIIASCVFITIYCAGYVYMFGAILEFILGNILQGIVRLMCGLVLFYYIWHLYKGVCFNLILYCGFKLL